MASIPEEVVQGWEKREGPAVFTTVDSDGMPNSVYVACMKMRGNTDIVVADNYFNKTRANIEAGSKGSLVFITSDHKSYQIKGELSRDSTGAEYEAMKEWLDEKLPGEAAVVLRPSEVYSGAEKLA